MKKGEGVGVGEEKDELGSGHNRDSGKLGDGGSFIKTSSESLLLMLLWIWRG